MNKQLVFGLVALLVFLAACAVIPQPPAPRPIACTEEAKLCPGGSAVGRVPPDCEFAPCPAVSKDACLTDEDCVCDGIDTQTGDCFVGNNEYYALFVNKEQQCPDFCTGIDGGRQTRCVENRCMTVRIAEPSSIGPVIEITAEPQSGEMPLFVNLTATLQGAEPDDMRFYCVSKHWTYGDGMTDPPEPAALCGPVPSDFNIQTIYKTTHRYEQPGTYEVIFRLGVLASQPILVTVLPERFPPECDDDSDCVPAQCCHAADCIIKEKRVDCSKVFCTQDCRPGTLDCGGSCACIAGRCSGKNFVPGQDTFNGPRPWQAFP